MVTGSLKTRDQVTDGTLIPHHVTWHNYVYVFTQVPFTRYLLPRELEEAAIVDGCGYWRVYWSVVLPLSRPILSALAVFFFLANWNAFVWPLVATNNPDLTVVQLGIAAFQSQYTSNWNYILAAATVAAIPMLVLFFAFQRQIVESIKTSGLK